MYEMLYGNKLFGKKDKNDIAQRNQNYESCMKDVTHLKEDIQSTTNPPRKQSLKLLLALLEFRAYKRFSASQALTHNYFSEKLDFTSSLDDKTEDPRNLESVSLTRKAIESSDLGINQLNDSCCSPRTPPLFLRDLSANSILSQSPPVTKLGMKMVSAESIKYKSSVLNGQQKQYFTFYNFADAVEEPDGDEHIPNENNSTELPTMKPIIREKKRCLTTKLG
jgi:serine/threonine protein kinase